MKRTCLAVLLSVVLLKSFSASGKTEKPISGDAPVSSPAATDVSPSINLLRRSLESRGRTAVIEFWKEVRKSGTPLIEAIPHTDYSFVTFLWRGNSDTRNVVVFDGVAGFDAKDRMLRLNNTDVWYKTYRVRNDARFAYNLSPNDSLQPFDDVKGDQAMRSRLAMLQPDPLNPRHCPTTFGAYGAESSYVELPDAPPLLWSSSTEGVPKGTIIRAAIRSTSLKREKKLFVYTPYGFTKEKTRYPLLVLFDGDRNVMWIPKILDLLIAQKRIPPTVAVMTDDSMPTYRRTELPCNPQFADFVAEELVPWARENYKVTRQPDQTIVAGSSYGGLASVFTALRHSEVFGNVISLSGSFWWKPDGDKGGEWLTKQVSASPKKPLRFYLEVGLMETYPGQIIGNRHMEDALKLKGYPVAYSEYDGAHSFLNWSQGVADGLLWLLNARPGTGTRSTAGEH